MRQEHIIELAKQNGFLVNHFLRLVDKKSGVEVSGKFTKYKQHKKNGLRLKGDKFEIEIITHGEINFNIIQSINLN
jgi:hypothetical protein